MHIPKAFGSSTFNDCRFHLMFTGHWYIVIHFSCSSSFHCSSFMFKRWSWRSSLEQPSETNAIAFEFDTIFLGSNTFPKATPISICHAITLFVFQFSNGKLYAVFVIQGNHFHICFNFIKWWIEHERENVNDEWQMANNEINQRNTSSLTNVLSSFQFPFSRSLSLCLSPYFQLVN